MSLFAKTPSVVKINGIQIQSAVSALPIPLIYGSPRVPCNIIYANGFKAVKQKQGGGKGILTSGKGGSNQFLYYATLIAAIGEGPIQNIIEIFQDTNQYFNLSGIREVDPNNQTGKSGQPNYVPTNAQFFPGGPNQIPWGYISGRWPTDARSYKDTCYIGLPNMQLDASGTPPQLNFVPRGMFAGTCPLNPSNLTGTFTDNNGQHRSNFFAGLMDADPAKVVYDFLTNSRYGAGFPSELIDISLFTSPAGETSGVGDSAFQTYCQAVGFGWSVVLNNSEAAGSVVERWMRNVATAVVWTGETLKFIPYLGSASQLNPNFDPTSKISHKYFVPLTASVFDFTEIHVLQAHNPEEEPVTLDRVDPIDVYNYFRVSFRDRANQFNDNVAEESDEVEIELHGPRVDLAGQADELNLFAYAKQSATMQLRRSVSIRRHVTFRLPPVFSFLDPMDVITITSGNLSQFGARITSIEEDADGSLTVIAEEFPQARVTTFFSELPSPPTIFQTNIPVQDINPPIILEPTAQLLAAQNLPYQTVLVGISGGPNRVFDPNWGGARAWISLDNATYASLTNTLGSPIQLGPSTMGYLTANLSAFAGTNPDMSSVLSVDLSESDGELTSTTNSIAAQLLPTLCAVVDPDGCYELLSYTTATLTGLNTYNLTGLYRGLYGTPALEHLAPNAQFLRIDSPFFEARLLEQFVSQPFYLKFTSFNIYNQAEQDLSEVIAYQYTPTGAGIDYSTNPIIVAVNAGLTVDLNLVADSVQHIDLNLGGDTACSPTIFTLDFGGPSPTPMYSIGAARINGTYLKPAGGFITSPGTNPVKGTISFWVRQNTWNTFAIIGESRFVNDGTEFPGINLAYTSNCIVAGGGGNYVNPLNIDTTSFTPGFDMQPPGLNYFVQPIFFNDFNETMGDGVWHHVMMAWDFTTWDGLTDNLFILVDGVTYNHKSAILSSESNQGGNPTNPPTGFAFNSDPTGLGSFGGSVGQFLLYLPFDYNNATGEPSTTDVNVDVADIWLMLDTKLDLTDSAVVAKFIDVATGGPADLGSNGSAPTGSQPDLFLHLDIGDTNGNNFGTNRGLGGTINRVGNNITVGPIPPTVGA